MKINIDGSTILTGIVFLVIVLLISRDLIAWWTKTSVVIKELREANAVQHAMLDELRAIRTNTAAQIETPAPPPAIPHAAQTPKYTYPPQFTGARRDWPAAAGLTDEEKGSR